MPEPLDDVPVYFAGEPMTDPFPLVTPTTAALEEEPIPDTLRMVAPEDAARATLNGIAGALSRDEVRVLVRIAERLQAGRRAYGPLILSADGRTFRSKEAREELEDALVYLACAWLKTEAHEVA
jgi:hypothetical protein